MKDIYKFKQGDTITRIAPGKPYSEERIGFLGEKEGGVRDRSYIGEKLIFMGITNGCIYLKPQSKFYQTLFGDKMLSVPLDIFDEGWEYWQDPEELFKNPGQSINIDKSSIEERIKKAEEAEDYELAAKLKKELEK